MNLAIQIATLLLTIWISGKAGMRWGPFLFFTILFQLGLLGRRTEEVIKFSEVSSDYWRLWWTTYNGVTLFASVFCFARRIVKRNRKELRAIVDSVFKDFEPTIRQLDQELH